MFSNGYELEQRVSSFMAGVYGWMSCALAITAGTAYYVATTPAVFNYLRLNPSMLVGLCVAQVVLVFAITFLINRIPFIVALTLFLLYSISVGVTLSSIFYVYTQISIISTFLTTACMFGVMSFYGYVTKSDLTSMGNMSFMILIGMVVGMVVNIFLGSQQLDYILSGVGVVVFVLLTASDTQKIKQMARPMLLDQESISKIALIGALTLYLDFLNLFLFLLRFMGNRREQ